MKLDVRTIAREKGASMDVDVSALPSELGLDYEEHVFDAAVPVRLRGTLQNAGHGILVLLAEADTAYTTECARCLTPLHRELTVPIREAFRPDRPLSQDAADETGMDEEDLRDTYTYRGVQIQLDGPVRDGILAALPYRELCDAQCRGLCPVCGRNRNEGPCGCDLTEPLATDGNGGESPGSPFEKLKELL